MYSSLAPTEATVKCYPLQPEDVSSTGGEAAISGFFAFAPVPFLLFDIDLSSVMPGFMPTYETALTRGGMEDFTESSTQEHYLKTPSRKVFIVRGRIASIRRAEPPILDMDDIPDLDICELVAEPPPMNTWTLKGRIGRIRRTTPPILDPEEMNE